MRLSLSLLVLALSGCVAMAPNAEELNKADYGKEPDPAFYRPFIEKALKADLFDPFSAVVEIGEKHEKGWCRIQEPMFQVRFIYGWRVCARVNAKNRFGGYVGWHGYSFFFRGTECVATTTEY